MNLTSKLTGHAGSTVKLYSLLLLNGCQHASMCCGMQSQSTTKLLQIISMGDDLKGFQQLFRICLHAKVSTSAFDERSRTLISWL